MFKSSKFNIATQNPETGETILFNTLSGSTASIDMNTLPIAKKILNNPNEYSIKEENVFNFLKKSKFIINDDVNEIEILKNRKKCGIKDNNRLDVTIMPNLNCNFACPYCYEKHNKSNTISLETQKSIKRWIKSIIGNHKVLFLNWFGGEPLLSSEEIVSLGSYIKKECLKNDVILLTNMTTNGYAFTDKIIKEFILLEMFNFQITIDGPPEIHNKTRILKNGKGSFERVLSNVINLAKADKKVRISLRINYNHNNIHSIPELLPLFPLDIRYQLRIVYEPIFGNDELSATENLSSEEISKSIIEYYELAKSMGFDVTHGGLGIGKLVYCYAERENQYIINYNGDVFKCAVTDFKSEDRIGFINNEGKFIKETNKYKSWFGMDLFEDKCEECSFLPLCMGGCTKDRLKNGTTGSYCNLVPTNASYALKSIAFGSFNEILKNEVKMSKECSKA